jgi:endonuclease/exonuclease/phosphatase family metal-dependent hydrolase
MAYNLHQAFATSGEMDVDAIAQVIVDSGASVVGLQEVARGGLLNANTDLVHLLGDRLGWEHVVFFGTTDPVWGNAILSRYPLGEPERRELPTVGTPYRRGYLAAPVATPDGEVLFISTHLQHINDPDTHDEDPEADLYPVHTEQLGVILEEWDGRQPAVLVGDLNARPGWRQVEELLSAGIGPLRRGRRPERRIGKLGGYSTLSTSMTSATSSPPHLPRVWRLAENTVIRAENRRVRKAWTEARTAGRRRRNPSESVMNPGEIRNAPATRMAAPSLSSRPGS